MLNIKPTLIRVGCASCGALTTLPIDFFQTKMITGENIQFNIKEFGLLFLMSNIFAFQNYIYHFFKFIPNHTIRGSIAAISISPAVIYIKLQKFNSRLSIKPIYKNFIALTIIREILFYSSLYTLYMKKFYNYLFISPLIANIIVFPMKFLIFKYSYPSININTDLNNIKNSAIIEIIKSTLGDSIALYLLFKFV